MRIRPARDGDAEAVTTLWTEAYVGHPGEGRQVPYERADFDAAVAAATVLVVEEDSADPGMAAPEGADRNAAERDSVSLLAVVALKPPGSPRRAVAVGDEAELARLAVAPSARRRGIGGELVRRCEQLAREGRASAIALWSRPHQRDAHRLYEAHGYRRVPERDRGDANGERSVFILDLGRG